MFTRHAFEQGEQPSSAGRPAVEHSRTPSGKILAVTDTMATTSFLIWLITKRFPQDSIRHRRALRYFGHLSLWRLWEVVLRSPYRKTKRGIAALPSQVKRAVKDNNWN